MIFQELALQGAYIIEPERWEDERGFFARTWCQREFEERGLDARIVQCSISYNKRKGTLRGMHFQHPPHEETKLVRCTAGVIYDVIIDLRRESPTFRQSIGVELTADDGRAMYIPKGLAHGFQTLTDETVVFYQMSEYYAPQAARGVRWNDSAFGIKWPIVPPPVISDKDGSYELFTW